MSFSPSIIRSHGLCSLTATCTSHGHSARTLGKCLGARATSSNAKYRATCEPGIVDNYFTARTKSCSTVGTDKNGTALYASCSTEKPGASDTHPT